jgi:membrane associated rhomboid family serine protease
MPAILAGMIIMYLGMASGGRGRVSHEGHLGGAAAGAAIFFLRKLLLRY